jgi:hypothetical protein
MVVAYLSVQTVNEWGPEDQVGNRKRYKENDKSRHASVDDALKFPIG